MESGGRKRSSRSRSRSEDELIARKGGKGEYGESSRVREESNRQPKENDKYSRSPASESSATEKVDKKDAHDKRSRSMKRTAKKRRCRSSSSESTQGSSSDSEDNSTKRHSKSKSKKSKKKHRSKRKKKKSHKSKDKKKTAKEQDKEEKASENTTESQGHDSDDFIGPSPEKMCRNSMKPMTKEEWDKQQSVVKRVYDPETGRHRLIKGDGEVLEEIVSYQKHREINKMATAGDGTYFQSKLGLNKQ